MNKRIAPELKKIEILAKQSFNMTTAKTIIPLCLFHRENKLFILNGYTQYRTFNTPFLLLKL